MYKIEILDKYHLIYVDYVDNSSTTKLTVPVEDRLTNTIVTYMDFRGFLHIDLFVGTEQETGDEEWVNEDNWVTTALIYHKCFNEPWNTDFATTVLQVPCPLRYRGNVVHIYNVPAYDTCGEIYYEAKTYRYKCICCDDCKYSLEENWEEYDFQIILDDIVSIVTDLMTEANDINYGLLTPDEEYINNLIEDLFLKWLTDEKLQQVVNDWLNNQDISSVVKEWLADQDFSEEFELVVNEWMDKQNIQQLINSYMQGQDLQELVNYWMDQQNFENNINEAITNAINEIDFDSLAKQFVNEIMSTIDIESLVSEWLENDVNTEIFKDEINKYLTAYDFTDDVNNYVENYITGNWDKIQDIVEQLLIDLNIEHLVDEAIQNVVKDFDFNTAISEAINKYFEDNDIATVVNQNVQDYIDNNIDNILNEYFTETGSDNLQDVVDGLLDEKIGTYLENMKNMLLSNERVVANALSRHEEDILTLKG